MRPDENPFDPFGYMTKRKLITAFILAFIMFTVSQVKGYEAADCFFYSHLPTFINRLTDYGVSDAMIEARQRFCH